MPVDIDDYKLNVDELEPLNNMNNIIACVHHGNVEPVKETIIKAEHGIINRAVAAETSSYLDALKNEAM